MAQRAHVNDRERAHARCMTFVRSYHNEHHDFPNIAWSRLPRVREMCPEFYDHLPRCESWPGLILRYICDDAVGAFSRVKRDDPNEQIKKAD